MEWQSNEFMKTIVSISPIRVEADSRTFKQAASIRSFGYASVVVEGERSSLERNGLPFELHSVRNGASSSREGKRAIDEVSKQREEPEAKSVEPVLKPPFERKKWPSRFKWIDT